MFKGTVLHEFGHALGFVHENPGNVPYDVKAVYAYYSGPPNNWNDEQIERNVLKKEGKRLTKPDAKSIMSYSVPIGLLDTSNPDHEQYVHGFNSELSDLDRQAAEETYK